MRQVLLNARALACIVEALQNQLAPMEQRRASLSMDESNDDLRSDLNNDIGYMTSLIAHLEHELKLDLQG